MNLLNTYLEQAKLLHQNPTKWTGTSLRKYIPEINQLIKKHNIKSILDYGCGKAEHHPLEWNADKYDPAVPQYSNKPFKKYDLVISTDVIEHIPIDYVPMIIKDIFSYSNHLVFITTCCREAKEILPNGLNAHATVQTEQWWKEQLKPYDNYILQFSQ